MGKFDPIQAMRDVQHFGEEGGVVPVIDVASTSTFLNPKDMERVFEGELRGCYLYSRHSNPTVNMFGTKLAAMENSEAAIGVSSGMSAIKCTLEQICKGGDHILASNTIYGGTYALLANIFSKRGIEVSFVDINNLEAVKKSIQPNTRAIYAETVSNPMLTVVDIRALKSLAQTQNIKLVIDNTFMPSVVTPINFGADVVVYSCTKYISGASDMIAGAIVSDQEFISSLLDINEGQVMLSGPVLDPRIAYQMYVRLDHLPLRMKEHGKAALEFSRALVQEGLNPIYPGLKTHISFQCLEKQINSDMGFGGMVTLDMGTHEKALELASLLQTERFGLFAVSLGFSRTLVSLPAASTSSEIPEEERKKIGLKDGLIRLSMGYTGNSKTMIERFLNCYRRVTS